MRSHSAPSCRFIVERISRSVTGRWLLMTQGISVKEVKVQLQSLVRRISHTPTSG